MSSSLPLLSHFSLQSHNSFGIAAIARHYCRITDTGQLPLLMAALASPAAPLASSPPVLSVMPDLPDLSGLPCLILGGGSNVILTRDFPGVVVHMALLGKACMAEDATQRLVRVAAGENWHDFVQWTLSQGWGGLENLSLIPGSAGAAPIQNIGAYGAEIKDFFHSLNWFEFATGQTHTMDRAACQFAYRDSIFKNSLRDQGVIVDVTFALPKQWQPRLGYGDVASALTSIAEPTPQQVSDAICAIRRQKLPDPKVIGNVGSFFKNPLVTLAQRNALQTRWPHLVSYPQPDGRHAKLAAGWLIEQTGWKGRALGQAGVYAKQALVLVNLGTASGGDVQVLAQTIQNAVFTQFAVQLEVEPVFV